MAEAKNPLEELSELFAIEPATVDGGRSDEVYSQVRFGETELQIEDGTIFKVSIARAFLALDLDGVTIVPGSEYGAVVKPNEVEVKQVTEVQSEAKYGGVVSGELSCKASMKASASVGGTSTKQTKKTIASSSTQTRVTPRGGQKWEIMAIDEPRLDGDYIPPAVALCRLRAKQGANQQVVTASIYVKQRDLLFRCDTSGAIAKIKLSLNKEKLLNILIAKALNSRSARGNTLYTGALILSETVSEHEA